jgi:large exoprotein involved in heme utilization and adhesion
LAPSTTDSNTSQPGNIDIHVTEAVTLADRSFIANVVQPGAVGKGGNINITAGSFSATNGSQVATNTLGEGNAGTIAITADTLSFDNGSGVLASVEPGAKGNGGTIILNAGLLEMTDGSQIQPSTKGEGNAGNVTLDISRRISFSGVSDNGLSSGVTSTSEPDAVGDSSTITIITRQLDIQDGGAVTVNSAGGGQAGNIRITADNIFLNHQGIISATTQSVFDGGNITLDLEDSILMRHNSVISTSAGTAQGGGDGGSIMINAPHGFVIGISHENSDITANAFEGNGGNIDITTQRIFGLQERPHLTEKSDITASSEFGLVGTIDTTQLALDPTNGLVNLPVQTSPPPVAQSCQPGEVNANRFYSVGHGGLPPTPNETLGSHALGVPDWVSLDSENSTSATHSTRNRIIEAQGWMKRPDGTVVLTAQPTTRTLLPTCTEL